MILVSADDEAAALKPQRDLELCEKCVGDNTCNAVDQSKIGCGSCIGTGACANLASDVVIGANSCHGNWACYNAEGKLNIYCVVG